jgi:predicted transcriptional regulator
MDRSALNRNELEALRVLWEHAELKPAEIEAEFSWSIENATLRSALVNLVGKGYVRREQRGKAFFYSARIHKTTLLQSMIQTLAQVFAGGSHRELVSQLVETGDIKPDDLKLLSETAAEPAMGKTRRKSK